jgi:chaperonin cofactor prefoldin
VDKDLEKELEIINLRLQQIEQNQKILLEKISKHIDFIDETYEGLRNPINAAKRFLGR